MHNMILQNSYFQFPEVITPFAHYAFNETSGVSALSENSDKPLTANNSSLWEPNGYNGGAVNFNVENARFEMTIADANELIINDSFSFSFWYKSTDVITTRYLIDRSGGGGSRIFRFYIDNNQYRLLVGNSTGNWAFTGFSNFGQPVVGVWVHIACVITTTGYIIYVDGKKAFKATYADNGGFLQHPSQLLTVGNTLNNGKYIMDELHFFDKELTQKEIIQIKRL